MINKNQFEKSMYVLKDNIPVFVRESYQKFYELLTDTVDILNIAFERSPSSTNNIAKDLITNNRCLFETFKSLIGKNKAVAYLESLNSLAITDTNYTEINADEEFSIVNSTDIYAPVNTIAPVVTPFSSKAYCENAINCRNIPIMFEINNNSFYRSERIGRPDDSFCTITSKDITGLLGRKTVLDSCSTTCGIDICFLIDAFFKECLDTYCNVTEEFTDFFEALKSVKNAITEDFSEEVTAKIQKKLLASAVSTYFVYATKLIGAKPDIFQWMYTSFVKDSANHYDKTHYMFNAPITVSSGHAIKGRSYGPDANNYTKSNVDMTAATTDISGNGDNAVKSLIYRNIRLQYSAWAATINAVLGTESRRDCFIDFDTSRINNFNYEKSSESVLNFVRIVLCEYLKTAYRTYNTNIQVGEELKINDSSKLIEISSKQVKDYNAIEIIKSSIKGFAESEIFINYTKEVAGILTLNINVKKALAETFLDAAYILMMNYAHETISKIYEQIDPTTGKTNKELFEEIYYGVVKKIDMDINKYSYVNLCNLDSNIEASILAYTPYVTNSDYAECAPDPDMENVYNRLTDDDTKKYGEMNEKFKDTVFVSIIKAPLISEYTAIKIKYGNLNINNNSIIASNVEKYGAKFPKNRIIVDALSRFGKTATNRAFATIESAKECVDVVEDFAEEGADCMANNAMYSALGSIGGGITEIEIINSADENNTDEVYTTVTPEETKEEDNDNNFLRESSSDPEDMAKLVNSSLEAMAPKVESDSSKVVKQYNNLFNKVLLGI